MVVVAVLASVWAAGGATGTGENATFTHNGTGNHSHNAAASNFTHATTSDTWLDEQLDGPCSGPRAPYGDCPPSTWSPELNLIGCARSPLDAR